ncbi:BTB/POZ domain-containing protein 1-like isoform X2 [Lycorma delicatula]|uniref:BTB/POZ domain-containing protein 1-like isoform X2 n=1 Tax=Lycorma delicatula TaxID=130591 RepID=UPI003F5125B4
MIFTLAFILHVSAVAHKCILGNASPVFQAMLYGDLSNEVAIKIENMEPEIFRKLLLFIYSDRIEFTSVDNACLIYDAAEMYNIPQLKKISEDYIVSNISVSDICYLYEFLKLHDNVSIKCVYMDIVEQETKSVLASKDFVTVDVGFLNELIEMPFLEIDSELELFKEIEKWARNQAEIQGKCLSRIAPSLSDVFTKVRFLSMTVGEFAEGPGLSKLLSTDDKLSLILNIIKPGMCPIPDRFCTIRTNRPKTGQ